MPHDGPIVSGGLPESVFAAVELDRQGRRDELLCFGDTSYQEVALKLEFAEFATPPSEEEATHVPVRDLRLRYAGHRREENDNFLRIQLADQSYAFRVNSCYRVHPDIDMIERWLEFDNQTNCDVTIDQLFFASLHFSPGRWDLLHCYGGWAAEFRREKNLLPFGSTVIESRSLQTGFVHNPFFLLSPQNEASEENGRVYFAQLAWSGSWRWVFEQRPNGALTAHGGYNPFDFELKLAPGENYVTPSLLLGCCDGGWGGASRRMHRHCRDNVLPRNDGELKPRPLLYNSWEATYFDLSHEGQVELAKRAAQIGVELFCVDDGWFGGRRSDQAGLGDWSVSDAAFPQGLNPLIEEVHRLGMRFGLWVEPEMVNRDSDLYRAHPDWVLHFPGRPRTEERSQLILDLGRDEVVSYLRQCLEKLLDEHQIDFIKWDMNRAVTEPGSVAGRGIWRRHVEALYAIIDGLREKRPQLQIESCQSGGGRVDLGILSRTDQVWTSDNTDALTRVQIQEGYSLAFPAIAMGCWVTHEKNHQTQRVLPLDLRFQVAMRGALGIGSDLSKLAESELADYAKWIEFYKTIRHIVAQGDCYRLQSLDDHGSSIVEYVLDDASEAVVSTIAVDRGVAQMIPPARLRGLDAQARYAARDCDGSIYAQAKGAELMSLGLEPNLGLGWYGPGYAATLHLTRE